MKRTLFSLLAASTTAATLLPTIAFAQTMGLPDAYFAHRGTIYARSGGTICGFRTPGHLQIYRTALPAPNVDVPGISSYRNAGVCSSPQAYFSYKKTTYFSFGDGRFCGFPNPDSLSEYRQYYKAPNVVGLNSPPEKFMKYVGACPTPQ